MYKPDQKMMNEFRLLFYHVQYIDAVIMFFQSFQYKLVCGGNNLQGVADSNSKYVRTFKNFKNWVGLTAPVHRF